MQIAKIILYILSTVSLFGTVCQLVRRDAWWIRIFDFPHFQLTVLTLLEIGGFVWLVVRSQENLKWFDYSLLGVLGVLLIYQCYIIFPYTQIASPQIKSATRENATRRISILESNVYMYNKNYEGFIELVRTHDPDIIVTLETDQAWKDGLKSLEEKYPHQVLVPKDNTYGILLYSRYELSNASVSYLIEEDVPSIETCVLLPDQSKIKLYVLHPKPPAPQHNPSSTERDAELLIIGKKIKDEDLPTIVTGDLNDVAWSHTTRLFQRTSNLLDPRIGRGFYSTFHARYYLLRWPLDHIFASDDFLLTQMKLLKNFGSDHLPMFTQLQLNTKAPLVNEPMDEPLDAGDKKEIERKIEEAK